MERFSLENKNGSAPGQFLDIEVSGQRKIVILLPGPPNELKPLFDESCKPRLAATLPVRHLARRVLRMALIPESRRRCPHCAYLSSSIQDVETTILAGHAEIQLHFLSSKNNSRGGPGKSRRTDREDPSTR